MQPSKLGEKYNKISKIYQNELVDSEYGLKQIERAISYSEKSGLALDVGCGPGGRVTEKLISAGFKVHGLDVSTSMIALAKETHPQCSFEVTDICQFESFKKYNLIVAWDSIFHLPLDSQKSVLLKLSNLLKKNGILIYTFGDAEGEHTDTWHEDTFYYSSIGINNNIQTLIDAGLSVMHLELDQYPQKHVYTIARKK